MTLTVLSVMNRPRHWKTSFFDATGEGAYDVPNKYKKFGQQYAEQLCAHVPTTFAAQCKKYFDFRLKEKGISSLPLLLFLDAANREGAEKLPSQKVTKASRFLVWLTEGERFEYTFTLDLKEGEEFDITKLAILEFEDWWDDDCDVFFDGGVDFADYSILADAIIYDDQIVMADSVDNVSVSCDASDVSLTDGKFNIL